MFSINYCDYNASNADTDRINRPLGSGDYLLLYFLAPMRIHMENKAVIAPTNSFILFSPGMPQIYEAVDKFRNSYIHFTVEKELIEELHIPLNKIFFLHHPATINEFIRRIQIEFFSEERHSDLLLDSFMKQMFITIERELYHSEKNPNIDSTLKEEFRTARLEILTHSEKDWTTESMSELVHIGKSQFFYYYKLFFNNSPKAELINARIEKAKFLLTNEAYQVKQVASLVGFQNVYHFIRYFKKCCGCTPQHFRKMI